MPGVFLVVLVALSALLSGCATQSRLLLQSAPADLPRKQELSATPFFPQARYQCGPAALAMALQAAGVEASPEMLVPQVYVPARKGSLQTEMLAAGRRNGTLVMTIPPRLDAVLREVAAGAPVVVLQNLSLPIYPVWHYAVVIGYDLDAGEILLRSGTIRRLRMPLSTFEHTWARSGYWAMVALPPGRLPVTAREDSAVPAVVALEKTLQPEQLRQAYDAALQRWPDNLVLQLGLGNSAYAAGDLQLAASAFRRAVATHPDSAPALNNLATALAELGDYPAARAAAARAVALGGRWADVARATLDAVDQAQSGN